MDCNLRARRDNIVWDPRFECFGRMVKSKFNKMPGLEKSIKKVFPVHIGKFAKVYRQDKRVVGRKGGSLVHTQLEKCINLLKQERPWTSVKKLTPEVHLIMNRIIQNKWKPLYSEYPIGDVAHNVATALGNIYQ